MIRLLPLILALALASCGRGGKPQPPTAEQNAQMDEMGGMLDNLANEEGAAPEGTAPQNSVGLDGPGTK